MKLSSAKPRVLVLGSGGREHALCWHLQEMGAQVECAPGSDAISKIVPVFPFETIQELSKTLDPKVFDEIIVGPEKYLEEGVADLLTAKKFSVFGPTKAAAQLETSKAFAKEFLFRHKIPTARSETLNSSAEVLKTLENFKPPYVVKASGLAAGKGVWIGENKKEAAAQAEEFLKSHSAVVIEEFLEGEEISYFALVDGQKRAYLGAAQDHKRLLENDLGPNTGGMGAYSPPPLLSEDLREKIEREVMDVVMKGLEADGIQYRGFLFVGLMIVRGKPYVLEFNCRLGDPETQCLMMRLKTPLLDLIHSLKSDGAAIEPEFFPGVSMNVVVASKGYPEKPDSGFMIPALQTQAEGCVIFHSGTKLHNSHWEAKGGRLFSVATRQESLADCQNKIYTWLEGVTLGERLVFRKDIGARAFKHLVS